MNRRSLLKMLATVPAGSLMAEQLDWLARQPVSVIKPISYADLDFALFDQHRKGMLLMLEYDRTFAAEDTITVTFDSGGTFRLSGGVREIG